MSGQFDPITGYPIDTSPGTTTGFAYDPITGDVVDTAPGTPGAGWNNPGSWGTFLTDLQKSDFGNVLKSLFGGNYGNASQMAAFTGISALLNGMSGGGGGSQAPVGYQGGIPQYTIQRAQTPIQQQRPAGYRPGQGGITYFTPIQYTKTGRDLGAAPAAPAESPAVTTPVETQETISAAHGGYMPGGIAMLAGGRYLRGPGDGVSDSIPAKFEQSGQPARLADGEFVIDARTVSEIGNGSSEAGARKLYAMMDRVHKARKTAKRGKPSGADKFLPK